MNSIHEEMKKALSELKECNAEHKKQVKQFFDKSGYDYDDTTLIVNWKEYPGLNQDLMDKKVKLSNDLPDGIFYVFIMDLKWEPPYKYERKVR